MKDRAIMAQSPPALPLFPFAAIAGQAGLRTALLLAAIDPRIGGVLVQGPRGTAKSTGARALAELLPDAPFVTLPLGATREHVVGTLDLQAALSMSELRFAPGLLARAHGGVLYVDEINLLPDALVDVLLDAAASGVNVIERDGISHSHAARFVLVGTMNPEEGMLRPQLLDRMGLCVHLSNVGDVALRQSIVRARLAFDANPAAFRAQHADEQQRLADRLGEARRRLAAEGELPWSDAVLQSAGELCVAAQVDGMRGDIVLLRAARAYAAWSNAPEVLPEHVHAVAEWALVHRRKAGAASRGVSSASPPSSSASPEHARESSARDQPSAQDDWGHMPPQPVGVARSETASRWMREPPRPGESLAKKA
ncbi:ATP-binding protein [Diaphorobacter aerolatus]|uniref:ATP-binding protein n=2 Tax=Diaphorobacter aerolatus TaxID=1288495 RepID=A0A7H0GQF6_9BURK|nr:ATP-binding protein [Diaphorobacter aerolatus]